MPLDIAIEHSLKDMHMHGFLIPRRDGRTQLRLMRGKFDMDIIWARKAKPSYTRYTLYSLNNIDI
uniref:Uncharacterized protein n=1 Tax=Magallana gigas TaxID=29159 RepID=K1Q372_MAGGI